MLQSSCHLSEVPFKLAQEQSIEIFIKRDFMGKQLHLAGVKLAAFGLDSAGMFSEIMNHLYSLVSLSIKKTWTGLEEDD